MWQVLAVLLHTHHSLTDHLEFPEWSEDRFPVVTCVDIGNFLKDKCAGRPRAWIPFMFLTTNATVDT